MVYQSYLSLIQSIQRRSSADQAKSTYFIKLICLLFRISEKRKRSQQRTRKKVVIVGFGDDRRSLTVSVTETKIYLG
jgi:hypothetical protein